MDIEEILKLFDSCWFEMEIFKKQACSSSFEENPDQQNQEKPSKAEITPIFTKIPTLHKRSMSDQLSSKASFTSCSLSPDSVLFTPNLQTILSGKEVITAEEELEEPKQSQIQESPKRKVISSRRRRKKGISKSFSDLEFEELKGFMDLGFVFSEEDKNSKLVEIIPGLQRLGKKDCEEEKKNVDGKRLENKVSRPYLSEAWEVFDRRRKENPLMNWRIPALGNEIDMRDNLRWWAHTVASTVR